MEQLTQSNVVRLIKKVQSAYFYSLFFFSSSSVVLLVLHLMKSYSSESLVSALKFNFDRNHVFLICNGILVILVKSSASLSTSPSLDSSTDYSNSSNSSGGAAVQSLPRSVVLTDKRKQQEEPSAVSSKQKVTTDVKVLGFSTVETVISEVLLHVHHQKVVVPECEVHVHEHDDDDDDHGKDDHDDVDDDEEDAEELNKRCEDFIRRMKQGIISESRKDLGFPRFS